MLTGRSTIEVKMDTIRVPSKEFHSREKNLLNSLRVKAYETTRVSNSDWSIRNSNNLSYKTFSHSDSCQLSYLLCANQNNMEKTISQRKLKWDRRIEILWFQVRWNELHQEFQQESN